MNQINKNYKINVYKSADLIESKSLVIFLKKLFKNINYSEWKWEYIKVQKIHIHL